VLKKLYLGALRCYPDQAEARLKVISNIAEKCTKNLDEFSISFTNNLIDHLLDFLDSCTKLKKLCITGSFEHAGESLLSIGDSIPKTLKSLTISTKWDNILECFEGVFCKV